MLSFGGGTNSTALLLELHRRGEMPDVVLFADTGGEKPHTYRSLENINAWLVSRGTPPIVTVKAEFGPYKTLEENCLVNSTLPSVAFGFKTCSHKWKIEPQERWARSWQPAIETWARGEKVVKFLGYDADEERRAKIRDDDKYVYRYPLIEWGWTRVECADAVARASLPMVGKSSCFFCPNSKRHEVRSLKKSHPDLYDRAVAIEDGAQKGLTSVLGLGRTWKWRDLGATDDAQGTLFDYVQDMPCGCYDG